MASLMNLALSAGQLFTGYINGAFGVTLVALLALPPLRRDQSRGCLRIGSGL